MQSFSYSLYKGGMRMKRIQLKAYKPGTIIAGKYRLIDYCIITSHRYSKRHHCIMYTVRTDTGMKKELSYISIKNILPEEFESYDTFNVYAYESGDYVYIKDTYYNGYKIAKIIEIVNDLDYIAYKVQFSDGSFHKIDEDGIAFKYVKKNILKMTKHLFILKDIIKQEKQFKQLDNSFRYICNSKFIYIIKLFKTIYGYL